MYTDTNEKDRISIHCKSVTLKWRDAHVRTQTKVGQKNQDWGQHCQNVAHLCLLAASRLRLESLAKLIGLLHDFGKGTQDWQDYLFDIGHKHPPHAALGALYAWRRWGESEQDVKKRRTAQLISLCIAGHHAGLQDCLNKAGESPFLDDLQKQSEAYYQEAQGNYYAEVASAAELDELFCAACQELDAFGLRNRPFPWGMLARLLLSILVDADRWDSACFENDEDPFAASQKALPDWTVFWQSWSNILSILSAFPNKERWLRPGGRYLSGAGPRAVPVLAFTPCLFPPEGAKPIPACGLPWHRPRKTGCSAFFTSFP
ncbi:MAG: CRISPR-associated endonuclease Cas3'' [Clostridiales bacterium]|nr:CRISPR-associated endonuclease Cas3'' [Clostridiales bacterium]